jgi:hypothetical protein
VSGWIGVDLDGTLATYGDWKGPNHIGEPIPAMIERVKQWLEEGLEVRIFTARVWGEKRQSIIKPIEDWCLEHIGQVLPITCEKDYGMIELWDDRCVQVEINTGRRMDGQP